MDEFQISCGKCKKSSPAIDWIERPSGLKLPPDCFQCPVCAVAFKRVTHTTKLEPGEKLPWWFGSWTTLEPIPAWL